MSVKSMKIAILAGDRFEQIELESPMKALKSAGAEVSLVSPKGGEIQGMNHNDPGGKIKSDASLDQVRPDDFDALMLPGGIGDPDVLRTLPEAVDFVRHFTEAKKPIGVICHGSWTMIEANGVRGRKMTSWPSLKTDLRNAGADWVDQEVVVDGNLVSSRKPDDLPAFNKAFIDLLDGLGVRQAD